MFIRTRIINGRPYVYREERWRENGKVKSRSRIFKGRLSSDNTYEENIEAAQISADRYIKAREKELAEKAEKEKAPPVKEAQVGEETKHASNEPHSPGEGATGEEV
jgi:hypothetical protein